MRDAVDAAAVSNRRIIGCMLFVVHAGQRGSGRERQGEAGRGRQGRQGQAGDAQVVGQGKVRVCVELDAGLSQAVADGQALEGEGKVEGRWKSGLFSTVTINPKTVQRLKLETAARNREQGRVLGFYWQLAAGRFNRISPEQTRGALRWQVLTC